MKYKIPLVVRRVQMYWDFSTQNLNSPITLFATQSVKETTIRLTCACV